MQDEREEATAPVLQAQARGWLQRRRYDVMLDEVELKRKIRAVLKLQCRWRCRNGQLAAHLLKQAKAERARDIIDSATLIQARWRGIKGRDRCEMFWEQKEAHDAEDAAVIMQCLVRARQARDLLRRRRQEMKEWVAARKKGADLLHEWLDGQQFKKAILMLVIRSRNEKKMALCTILQTLWRM